MIDCNRSPFSTLFPTLCYSPLKSTSIFTTISINPQNFLFRDYQFYLSLGMFVLFLKNQKFVLLLISASNCEQMSILMCFNRLSICLHFMYHFFQEVLFPRTRSLKHIFSEMLFFHSSSKETERDRDMSNVRPSSPDREQISAPLLMLQFLEIWSPLLYLFGKQKLFQDRYSSIIGNISWILTIQKPRFIFLKSNPPIRWKYYLDNFLVSLWCQKQ
jgi:hypothetical protein